MGGGVPTNIMRTSLQLSQRIHNVLQISEPVKVSSIDIGNDGSAFVQVLVRRAEQITPENSEDNDGFKTILPASSFLTPLESRNEESISRVRMFGHEKLSGDAVNQKWDQFKVLVQCYDKKCVFWNQLVKKRGNIELLSDYYCNYMLCLFLTTGGLYPAIQQAIAIWTILFHSKCGL